MDNELFELCKAVYEKMWWDDPDDWLHLKGNGQPMIFVPIGMHLMDCDAPLYTSDYLLEKLPHAIENDENPHGDNWLSLTNTDNLWCASYEEDVTLKGKYFAGCYDDTPLKALLKLTIALAEAGDLKGDKKGE